MKRVWSVFIEGTEESGRAASLQKGGSPGAQMDDPIVPCNKKTDWLRARKRGAYAGILKWFFSAIDIRDVRI